MKRGQIKYPYPLILVLSGLFLMLLVSGEGARRLNPGLEEELRDLRAWEKTSVIVFMEEQADLDAFVDSYPPAERRQAVIQKLQDVAAFTQEPLLVDLASKPEVEIVHTYWIFNGLALRAPKEVILEIAARPDVAEVSKDGVFKLPLMTFQDYIPTSQEEEVPWNLEKIGAPDVWNIFGNKGKGIRVAVIDTGVNEHPDLTGRIIDGNNYINPDEPPRDDNGHGTAIAGIIAGDGSQGTLTGTSETIAINNNGGTRTGVAPECDIIAIKLLNFLMEGTWSNLYKAIEEASEKKADIANLSLGGFPSQATRDHLRQACKNAIAAGVIPVIAAGNAGEQGITSPGDVHEVITVGATDENDNISSVSGRGNVVWGNESYIKPDLSAPGVEITSCAYDSNGYKKLGGELATSMSCPHVVGVAALMLNANPTLDTIKVKRIMEKTSKDLGEEGKDNTYGSGRIRALRAVIGAHFYNR